MKIAMALMPVWFGAMVYALTQGVWESAGLLAIIQLMMLRSYRVEQRYRAEERNRSPEAPEHPNEA
ncbi:MAG TPA: hypothetical protein VK480_10770 [Solirubrobacterales bacterium]|nr:hypothetical protein [Solirubrobacterales bacterium]